MDSHKDRWFRRILLPALAVLALAGGWLWFGRVDLAQVGMKSAPFERSAMMAMLQWQATPPQGVLRVVLFGDSLFLERGDEDHPKQVYSIGLGDSLKAERVPAAVLSLVQAAFRPIHLWYLLDDVIETRPDLVVVEVNLRLLGMHRHLPASYRFAALSRRMAPRRMLSLRNAMQVEEVDPIEPFLWKASEAMGTLYAAEGARDMGRETLKQFGLQTNAALGLSSMGRINVYEKLDTVDEVELMYGWDPEEHPGVDALRAIREELTTLGIPVLFVVAPIRTDLVAKLGMREEIDLPARVDRLREAIGASHQEWLNLSSALPQAAFRDEQNHLTHDGLQMESDRIARRTAQRLRVEHGDVLDQLHARQILPLLKRRVDQAGEGDAESASAGEAEGVGAEPGENWPGLKDG